MHAPTHAARWTSTRFPIRIGAAVLALGALPILLVQIGCAARNPVPVVGRLPYSGPELAVDRSGPTALIVMQAPTPGWAITFDHMGEAFQERSVFVTLTPPDPSFAYAQVIVEQRLATSVARDVTVRLFARVERPQGQERADGPYSLVLEAAPPAREAAEEPATGENVPGATP